MSPRRMDISSLLRDPSPPPRPRTIDALLHHAHPPASLLSLLNPHPRPPFLGLDALVHVAAEERQRIDAVDHARHYPVQDRPHKRPRDGPPRSPSPPASPSTRRYPSASPTSNYPTLLRQPPTLVNDTRAVARPPLSLQHTSPFQLPPHSSPRNNSPRRHSPQHLRSQHHSSPIQIASLVSAPSEAEAMSPRYGHGPRMAGGIQVLSNDARPDFSTYQSPGRDQPSDHAKLSPLSARVFSLDDDRHHARAPSFQVEAQECPLPRERVRSRPPHLPSPDATTNSAISMGMFAREADFPVQPFLERHPIRVWEEQPTAREAFRRVSPAHMPGGLAEGPAWSGTSGERPAKATALRQDVVENGVLPSIWSRCLTTDSLVTTPPKEPPPPHDPTPEPLASRSQTPAEGTCPDPQPSLPTPIQPRSPIQSEPQAHLPHTSLLNPSTPRAPASPVLHPHLETQSELWPEHSETQVDAGTSVPLTSSDPAVPEPVLAELMPGPVDADASLMANPLPRQPSPELVQPVLALEPEIGMSMHSTDVNVSQSPSRSPSQQPLLSAKDEPNDILISPPTEPEPPSRRSPEPEYTSERESASEHAMMDVDEELLSLVEDRPIRAVPAMSKAQIDSRLPLPITAGQATSAGVELGSSEASDGPTSLVPSSQPVLKGPPLVTDEEKDRTSMPPPATRNKKAEKDKTTAAASKKKKDGTSKVRISGFITRPTNPDVVSSFSPPLNRNSLQNHEPNPSPNRKLNPMRWMPL
jgi:hypothetical protein